MSERLPYVVIGVSFTALRVSLSGERLRSAGAHLCPCVHQKSGTSIMAGDVKEATTDRVGYTRHR